VAEVAGPWPVGEVQSLIAHNRKLPSEPERALKPRSRNRNPLDELERAPNLPRHRHQPVLPQHAAYPCGIQFFCISVSRTRRGACVGRVS